MSEILKDLNPEQLAAVKYNEGPLLIVAGAGSGKTRVLTSKIAYLIEKGVAPERILALTFTKKAAGEMKERIAQMVGAMQARRIWMGTFHSIFIRFLRDYAGWLGFPQSFTIYDTSDSENAIKACIDKLEEDSKGTEKYDTSKYKPRAILSQISRAKNALITPKPYSEGYGGFLESDIKHERPLVYKIYSEYCRLCKQSGVMDFDDILMYTNILLRDNKQALEDISSRFDYILVDEYQDTNFAQYVIIKKLAYRHHNVCVVGDDSQSIYGFRGAEIQNILNFQKDYPESKVLRLQSNYRSTQVIVNASNTLIAQNEGRIPKTCISMGAVGEKIHLLSSYSEKEEAAQIVSSIIERIRIDRAGYEDFAILYRTNSQSRVLEEALRRRNIPYAVYSGNSFFERAEVKDVMAYLKLAVNHNDNEAFKRIVNKPTRGIGDTSLKALASAAIANGVSLFDAVNLPRLDQFGLKNAAVTKLQAFCNMIESVNVREDKAFDAAMTLATESGIYQFYKSDTSLEGKSRFSNVEELFTSISSLEDEKKGEAINALLEDGIIADIDEVVEEQLPKVTIAGFLETVMLQSNADLDGDKTVNRVALMTAHTAKGLEYKYIYVAGMEESLFPLYQSWEGISLRDLEEERRLFYVAITRAKRLLSLSFAKSRRRNESIVFNRPSRFLKEIAPQYLDDPSLLEEDHSGKAIDDFSEKRSSFTSWRAPQQSKPVFQPKPSAPKPSYQPAPKPPLPDNRPPVIDANFVPDPMSSFRVGDRIEHNRFGAGEVIEITGKIPELKAKIHFDQYGDKLLLLKFAKLRHI